MTTPIPGHVDASDTDAMSARTSSTGTVATEDQYVAAIARHAAKSKEDYLFHGTNYRELVQFLRPPSPTRVASAHPGLRPNFARDSHVMVHTYTLGETPKIMRFDDLAQLQSKPADFSTRQNCCQLIFMQGFLQPVWLNKIGARYQINPEFFRRHLDFLLSQPLYDLPAMPSSSGNVLRLRITTICTRNSPISSKDVEKNRLMNVESVNKYQRQLEAGGESIVRQVNDHNENTYTLEQDISCYIQRRKENFVAIIWLDIGSKPVDSLGYTRHRHQEYITSPSDSYIPTVQHLSKGPLRQKERVRDRPFSSTNSPSTPCSTFQSSSLIPSMYGSTLQEEIVVRSPIYALSELVSFAAHSESQFLNFLQVQVTQELRVYEKQLGWSIDSLRYHKTLLDEHIGRIIEVIDFLDHCGAHLELGSAADGNHTPSGVVIESLDILRQDYKNLLAKAEVILARCTEGCRIIVENATLGQVAEGLLQSSRLGRLSAFAFFFLPLSFTTSLFGMNFIEFGSGTKSIYLFVILLVPVFGLSTLLAFPQIVPWGTRRNTA